MNNSINDYVQTACLSIRELSFIAEQAVSWKQTADDLSKTNYSLQIKLDNAYDRIKKIENRISDATLYLAITTDNVDTVKDKMTTFCIRCMGEKNEKDILTAAKKASKR